ncbi:serine-rich adhesin for platelets [Musca vetustissima]|uniref:serine-rich adhesin for platelets n=1 Tax=Musca vetustissima TaxID=27455 RepID=UPI002AB6D30B|nr:serine-rich adhesin for platelets [Musca vetustissima]
MPGGWWEGTLQSSGKTGMFPDNFVRVVDMNEDNTVVLRDKTSTSNRRCKVIYSYTQVNDDELSLAVGDVIEFLGEVEEGWWRGRLNNRIGVFPSNFVKVIEPSPVFASKRPPSLAKPTTITGTGSGTVLSSTAILNTATSSSIVASSSSTSSSSTTTTKKLNRLSFHNSKEDLLNSGTTIAANSTATLTAADDVAPSLPPKPQREHCRVEFPYAPQNDDELELKVGDIITIHSMELPDKGWWKGELRGKIGVFPDNFVKLIAPTEVSPLNDTQQTQPQQSHRTAKSSNLTATTTSTTITNNLGTAAATTTHTGSSTSTVKTLIKKSGSSSSTQSSNRKDSFGSRDSLNDILSETGLPTGNVAAQRKSLENKNLDLTNTSDVATRLALKKQQMHAQQQQQHQEAKVVTASSSINSSHSTNTNTTITTSSMGGATTTSELRKSMENMDEKSTKTTPPPVVNKKPTLPVKKTTTVTSITGNILSGIKQKVKSVENKLTTAASHDYADGIGSSKLSPSAVASDNSGVVMRRAATIAADSDFDRVERGSILTDMRAGRVKAPKRRPPSAAISTMGESNNNSLYVNGNGSDTTQSDDQLKSDDNSTGEEQLAKPKPREWEKKKAPWMEELKASQVKKKTSPNVDGAGTSGMGSLADRTSKLFSEDIKTTNQTVSSTNSTLTATSSSTKVQSSSVSSTSIMQQSMVVESSSSSSSSNVTSKTLTDAMTKSLSAKMASDAAAALAAASATNNNASTTTSSTSNTLLEDVRIRPNSLSIRNRSASPSMGGATRNVLKTTNTTSASPAAEATSSNAHHSNSHASSSVAKTTSSSTTTTSAADAPTVINNHHPNAHHHQLDNGHTTTSSKQQQVVDGKRVCDLEARVEKLELLVHAQQRTIDELVRTLREESDRNKVLRAELDKYAQCVTQV